MFLPVNTDQADKWRGWLYVVFRKYVCDTCLTFKENYPQTNAKAKELSQKAHFLLVFLPP